MCHLQLCLNYFSQAVSNFQALTAGILPLDCFLLLKLRNAKIRAWKQRLYFQLMWWSEIWYLPIYYCLFRRAKYKLCTVLIEQRFARVFEANLECSLLASRLVGEPIKCARSPPFGFCNWQAERLSLGHLGLLHV